jgi:trans-aconitate methyltransferase
MRKEVAQTRAYYNRNADAWVARKTNSFIHESVFQKLVKRWLERGNILDIGCSAGVLVPLFLGIGSKLQYTGIDSSTAFLKIAKRRYPQLPFIQADISEKASLPRKSFDGFVATAVLMHVPEYLWDTAFDNLESLMKKGAVGYVTLPIAPLSDKRRRGDIRHFTIKNEAEQVAYFKKRGWKIITKEIKWDFPGDERWRGYIVKLP